MLMSTRISDLFNSECKERNDVFQLAVAIVNDCPADWELAIETLKKDEKVNGNSTISLFLQCQISINATSMIDNAEYDRLNNLHTSNTFIESTKYYFMAHYFPDFSSSMRKLFLTKSVQCCSQYMTNHRDLGLVLLNCGNYYAGKLTIQEAISKIEQRYVTQSTGTGDTTNCNSPLGFLLEFTWGLHVSCQYAEYLTSISK